MLVIWNVMPCFLTPSSSSECLERMWPATTKSSVVGGNGAVRLPEIGRGLALGLGKSWWWERLLRGFLPLGWQVRHSGRRQRCGMWQQLQSKADPFLQPDMLFNWQVFLGASSHRTEQQNDGLWVRGPIWRGTYPEVNLEKPSKI